MFFFLGICVGVGVFVLVVLIIFIVYVVYCSWWKIFVFFEDDDDVLLKEFKYIVSNIFGG